MVKQTNPSLASVILKSIRSGYITEEDAIDDMEHFDPQTTLGQAFNDMMTSVVNMKLFDYFQGFLREGNSIKLFFDPVVSKNKMQDFVDYFQEDENFTYDREYYTSSIDFYRESAENEKSNWIVVLSLYIEDQEEGDEDEGYPAGVDMSGSMTTSAKQSSKNEIDQEKS